MEDRKTGRSVCWSRLESNCASSFHAEGDGSSPFIRLGSMPSPGTWVVLPCPACAPKTSTRRVKVAVLMTAHIPGATQEMINGMSPLLKQLPSQKGFVVHANGPVSGGWRVTEVWDSQGDFE